MSVGALSRAAAVVVGAGAVSRAGIWERLAAIPDHRSARGLVYPLPVLAAVWLCAVTAAGHDRVAAVTEWLAATSWTERVRLRLPWNPWDGHLLPDEATIRRFLNTVDDQALATALLDPPLADTPADLTDAVPSAPVRPPAGDQAVPVRAYAVDGKTSRGAKRADGSQVHLLGVAAHGAGALLGQREIDAKSNETTEFRALLAPLELAGAFVSFDALHTVRSNLDWLVVRKNAHYLAVAKHNQPKLRAFLAALPWTEIPTADLTRDRGHGREETRTLKVATVTHLDFPHAAQAIRIRRWRRQKGQPASHETVYAITDATADQASPALLADLARGQWHIEVKQHYVRDVTFGEDSSTSRTGRGPAVLALFRATVADTLRRAGHRSVPACRRAHKTATAALDLHGFP
ncbi:ISAs1 family transposase [Frankia sp. B2]|uniref:ISAs1 family transposase n=1 Tax=unclassified Frankia TaxID=2632575 RepID=UPI00046141D2|nr:MULTISPECIES: ISAs1 family transposase [unclassified Frankia]KDA40590.1 transposase, IS4 family [Frankia sp. BMG5.23]TFE24193.1 ISAs1 family transposase [Frankia sp. B2]